MRYESSVELTFNNETKTLVEWANQTGLSYKTLSSRLHRGWPVEKILTQRIEHHEAEIEVNGVVMGLKEWCGYLGISHQALYKSARLRTISTAEEVQRRFRDNPALFPKHLLPEQGDHE
jgi:hypothetical protein